MLTALFAVLWLITLGLLIRRGRLAQEAPVTPEETDEAALLAGFRRACHKGDAAGARQALSSWMRRFGPPYAHGSLMQFAQAVPDAGLARAIIDFDARSFSGETADDWRGQELWRAFEKWRAAADKHTQSASADTPDLYARAR